MTDRLRKMNPNEFATVWEILKDSFPSDEYRDYKEQKALLKNDKYTVYVLSDEEIKAFITVWKFDDFAFIEHFAVREKYRNLGIGTLILQQLCEKTSKQLCLEVELPENEKAKRRIGFYERNGFRLNNYHYEQPAYSAEKNPVPLLIMTYGSTIDENRFKEMKKIIFKEVYSTE